MRRILTILTTGMIIFCSISPVFAASIELTNPVSSSILSQSQFKIAVINPTPQNNPLASGFPGYRASNQLVVYAQLPGQPLPPNGRSGTNEFGFEVTVVNNMVVAQEGSDSAIPACPDCGTTPVPNSFVLSGHGKVRDWLIAYAPIGAHIDLSLQQPDPALPPVFQAISRLDANTYLVQLKQRLDGASGLSSDTKTALENTYANLRAEADQLPTDPLQREPLEKALAQKATSALETLNQALWSVGAPAFPISATKAAWHRPVEQNEAAVGTTLDRLKKAGLNTVFLETFFHGYTIFPSQTYSNYGLESQNPKFTAFSAAGNPSQVHDPLAAWVRQAHKRGMKLHIWFQTFYGGTTIFKSPGPLLKKYPEWVNVQYSALTGSQPATDSQDPNAAPQISNQPIKPSTLENAQYFLDPANPAVRVFLLTLLDEIASRYAVDGIQLDYIRYPAAFAPDRYNYLATTWGYTPYARTEFMSQNGIDPVELLQKMQALPRQATASGLSVTDYTLHNDPDAETRQQWAQWNAYKIAQVSSFVQEASIHLRTPRSPGFPPLKISAAVFPKIEDSVVKKHQDWASWAQAGWVDFLAPMSLTSAPKVVTEDVQRMVSLLGPTVPIVSGVFGPFNQSPAETILDQLAAAKTSGAAGFSLFDTAHLAPRTLEALQARLADLSIKEVPKTAESSMTCPKPVAPSNTHRRKK